MLPWVMGLPICVIALSWIVASSVAGADRVGRPLMGSLIAGADMNVASAVGQWAGVMATLIGFGFVLRQLAHEKEAQENHTKELAGQTSWMVYSNGLATLNVFFEHPEVRRYFYEDGVPTPTGHEREKVFAAAELLLDHWEGTFFSEELKDNINVLWYTYMIGMYGQSPSLQEFLKHENEGYRYCASFISVLSNKECIAKVRQFRKRELDKRTLDSAISAVVMAAKKNPGA
jgi:hypothetical protein